MRTVATPVLSPQKASHVARVMQILISPPHDLFDWYAQVFDRLYNCVHLKAAEHFGAFYSSELGGIVTNPAFMVLHMDDHMVHRESRCQPVLLINQH